MPQRRALNEILAELHEALGAAEDLGEGGREALREAVTEMRSALDAQQGGEVRDALSASMRGRLSDALAHFGESHPRITEGVRRLIDQLADLGI